MAKTKEARLQKTKFNSIGVRRQYHTQTASLRFGRVNRPVCRRDIGGGIIRIKERLKRNKIA